MAKLMSSYPLHGLERDRIAWLLDSLTVRTFNATLQGEACVHPTDAEYIAIWVRARHPTEYASSKQLGNRIRLLFGATFLLWLENQAVHYELDAPRQSRFMRSLTKARIEQQSFRDEKKAQWKRLVALVERQQGMNGCAVCGSEESLEFGAYHGSYLLSS